MTDYRDIAQLYRDEGLNPIPVKADKSPALSAGSNYLYDRINVIDERYISHGLAVTCGIASDGLECIDFDAHKGQDVQAVFDQFISDEQAEYIIKNNSVCLYKTPSGGFHIIYRCKYNTTTKTLAKYQDNDVMIEVRASGAYIVCDPSPKYDLIGGVELVKVGFIDRQDRDYLLNLAQTFSAIPIEEKKSNQINGKKWGSWDESTPWGKFNSEFGEQVTLLLTKAGWQHINTRPNGVQLWRRPGKNKGISATFGQYNNMFYCFTDAAEAHPFTANKAYSPTDLLMLLHFKGDWQRTKEYLYKRFNMQPPKPTQVELPDVTVLPFPLDVFPQPIQELITELNRTLNYKQDFLAVALLFTVATVNGNTYKLKVKNGWTAATSFWFAVVGDSGVMKSHPINAMVKPLKDIDKQEYKIYSDVVSSLPDDVKKSQKPVFKQILVEDFTLEAVHAIHKNNPRGLGLHKDELVGFLKDMNKYRNGSDEQFWLESFNNSSYIVNRVTKEPMMIDNIMINIIGSIQPQVLSSVAAESNGNGLIERFLYTTAESNVYPLNLDDINEQWMNYYAGVINEMHRLFNYLDKDSTIIMTLSQDALKRFVEIDAELCTIQMDDNESAGMKNYINKIKTYMPRFCLVLWLIDAFTVTFELSDTPISVEYVNRAKRLSDYFIASARKVFSESERRDEINTVGRILKAKGMTKAEQIMQLNDKGFKQIEIANMIKSPRSYVSKVIQEYNKKNGVTA